MQLITSDVPQAHTETEATSPRRWWTLAAVCTGVFMLLLDLTIVNVALPDIERAFQASLSDLQWVVSAYALTLAAFLLTAGSLADLYGRRLLFATGIVLFTAGSLCCGLATGSSSSLWRAADRWGSRPASPRWGRRWPRVSTAWCSTICAEPCSAARCTRSRTRSRSALLRKPSRACPPLRVEAWLSQLALRSSKA